MPKMRGNAHFAGRLASMRYFIDAYFYPLRSHQLILPEADIIVLLL